MISMKLQWKGFNINLKAVDAHLRGLCTVYSGNQANSVLELLFSSDPSSDDKAAIQSYWNGIASDSSEATSYQTADQVEAAEATAMAAKRASAKTKLVNLGLTSDEADAVLGME